MLTVTHNAATSVTTIVTANGQTQIPTALYNLFSACESTPLVTLCAQGVAAGFTQKQVRSFVQVLAPVGQYKGSPCIGAIQTATVGNRALITWGTGGVARPTLTRKNSGSAPTSAAPAIAS